MGDVTDLEFKAVVKFLRLEKVPIATIYERMLKVYEECPKLTTIQLWVKEIDRKFIMEEPKKKTRSLSWTRNDSLKLIEMYKNCPVLWDTHKYGEINRTRKMKIYEEFAAHFDTFAMEVQAKLHNLRRQYHLERKKIKIRNGEHTSNESIFVSTWYGYSKLRFLDAQFEPMEKTPPEIKQEPEIPSTEVQVKEEPMSDTDDASTSTFTKVTIKSEPKDEYHEDLVLYYPNYEKE